MMQTSLPDAVRSPERLAALHELALLDTPPEETFDRLTRLAARLLQVPVALVTLVDEDRQFFKSSVGLGEPWASRRQMPLAYSFCQHAVADKQTLVISDARNNDRVKNSPAVSENNSLAYVGVPLITDKGHALGTLCVVDSSPRLWDDDQVQVLSDLAAVVMDEIRLRQAVCDLARHALVEQEVRHAREAAEAALRQRAFVRDVLRNVTEGRLRLCDSPMDLPPALAPVGDPIPLRPATLQTFRQAIRTAAERYNMAAERAADLIAAAGEASMNVVVHAQNGAGRVCVDPVRGTIQVWVEDQGTGIAMNYLHRATLERGYTTAGSMGQGFWIMLHTCDRVWLLTGGEGTTVVLEQDATPSETAFV